MASVSFHRYTAVNGGLVKALPRLVPSKDKTAILHSYRSLLRAATYLPDSLARSRVHNEIVTKFRRRRTKQNFPRNLLSNLQKQVVKLQRAADSHVKELSSVLEFAYGRRGTTRRVLVTQLLDTPDSTVPTDSKGLKDLIAQTQAEKPASTHQRFKDNSKLAALLTSQKLHGSHFEGLKLKTLEPVIPKVNIWMRNTPVKVVANMEKKWWARTLSIVCPPVPEDEWHRLEALSLGKMEEGAPPKRTRTRSMEQHSIPNPSLEDFTTRIKGTPPKERGTIKGRGLRTLYGQIWSRSPMMTYDDVARKWDVEWGRVSTLSKVGLEAVRTVQSTELELFEGIETPVAAAQNSNQKGNLRNTPKVKESLST